jgi:hypothetical protein
MARIEFTSRPTYCNPAAAWQPTNMKVSGLRVWSFFRGGGLLNLHRVGRYGREFVTWSEDRIPNYLD